MVGRIVRSKSGHDKGKFYVVLQAAGEWVMLCDGKRRTTDRPKRKNVKHVSITNTFMDMNGITDLKLAEALKKFDEAVFKGGK